MPSDAFMKRVWQNEIARGLQVSFHSGPPGTTGKYLIAGPYRASAGDFRAGSKGLALARDVTYGPVEGAGRVRYIGLWTRDRVFIEPIAVQQAQDVSNGTSIRIRRDNLRLEH